MKRIDTYKKESIKDDQHPHFIGIWNIENDTLCKEIIDVFEDNKDRQNPGECGEGQNLKKKKTTDITISPHELNDLKFKSLKDYITELYNCYSDYQSKWPFLKKNFKEIHLGGFNIQKYSAGDHFSEIHSERVDLQSSHRIFAWMTYLNDVDDGGVTNFSHYNIRIKPEVGKTLIWPAEWTHAHSGEILNKGVKYIITGWLHFPH